MSPLNHGPFVACLALYGGVLMAPPAMAHPHLWATMNSAIVTSADGKVSGVRVFWLFDETYTEYSLEGLDLNKNGTFDPEEIKPLTEENIKSLAETSYFTYARQNNKALSPGAVTEYGQVLKDNKLELSFLMPFKEPVDPRAGEIEIKIYDPDFWIAFDYLPENAVKLEGKLADGCALDLRPLPTDEEIDQKRAFLASKGTDWKPDQPEDFGSMFAQALMVACK